jgi:TolB-like protein
MKKGNILIWLLTIIFLSCGSTQIQKVTNSEGIHQNQLIQHKQNEETQISTTDSGQSQRTQQLKNIQTPYYTGNGGQGISLAILAPESKGIELDLDYLPTLIQGVLVSDISKYSAIKVLDRVSLDKIFNETLNPIYEDENEFIELAHVVGTDYILTGNIVKTASDYTLQFKIDDSKNGMTKASYSGNCSVTELDNFTAIKKASLELLTQIGIDLTMVAKMELSATGIQQDINALTTLAQGILAQRNGTIVEAMSYYYNAITFDPSLTEARSRLSALSMNISSGNIGENVRNEIQRRNAWKAILDECETFFSRHLPYEIRYNPEIKQRGNINYQTSTVDLSFILTVRSNDGFKIIKNIIDGLEATEKREEWGFGYWPLTSKVFADRIFLGAVNPNLTDPIPTRLENYRFDMLGKQLTFEIELLNENDDVIAETSVSIVNKIGFRYIRYNHGRVYDTSRIIQEASTDYEIVFRNVNANNITDTLTINFIRINGINVISAGRTGYISISAL